MDRNYYRNIRTRVVVIILEKRNDLVRVRYTTSGKEGWYTEEDFKTKFRLIP